MLQEGDLWFSPKSIGQFRARQWSNRQWRDFATWSLYDLREHCDNDHLFKIEDRPKLATYTGIYRKERQAKMSPKKLSDWQQVIIDHLKRGKRIQAMVSDRGNISNVEIEGYYYRFNANSLKSLVRMGLVVMKDNIPGWKTFELATEEKTS